MHYYLEKAQLYSVGNFPNSKENQFHGNLICNVTETETNNHRNKNKYHFSK